MSTASDILGGFAVGASTPLGPVIGGGLGALGGWAFGRGDREFTGPTGRRGPQITIGEEQKARRDKQEALRRAAIEQSKGAEGAVARGASQAAAAALAGAGGAHMGGAGLLAMKDAAMGADAAILQEGMQATEYQRKLEEGPQEEMFAMKELLEELRREDRLTTEEIQELASMSSGDPEVLAMLQRAAATAPGKRTLTRDVSTAWDYLTS